MTRVSLALLVFLSACSAPLRTAIYSAPEAADVELSEPGSVSHEPVTSARWAVPLAGLVDLKDPRAESLKKERHPIVLPVHVLVHPTRGVFVVDTGVPRAKSPARGIIAMYSRSIEVVEPLADILARQEAPLAGVLLTHTHLDHILGLVDVPREIPVYVGDGDQRPAKSSDRLAFPTLRRALGDRELELWDFDGPGSIVIGKTRGIDIFGDGSVYAIDASGHTPGSTAYLARTASGPVLLTGDCSHTRWGWDHGVPPGKYTVDHERNAESLDALREIAAGLPGVTVYVGHEL